MIKRQNLPLSALRAFEAAARHQSFSAAAQELCVTHGAISQQIKRLEAQTRHALFHRHNRGVRLTKAGAALLPVLSDCFDRMGEALDACGRTAGQGPLRVTTTPFFASRWLVPRLANWRRRHAETNVDLTPSLQILDFAEAGIDVAIRCGSPPWPGLNAELLLPIHLSPLCSPALLEGPRALTRPQDLEHQTLIHADIAGHVPGEEWDTWLAAAGGTGPGGDAGLHFHEPALALQAAADGLGVAMGYLEFARPEIEDGRLVQPFALSVRHAFSYYLVTGDSAPLPAKIGDFAAWIKGEAVAFL